MNNDDMFRSLSRMAEDYNRIVNPLTEYLKIKDRWNEIASPVLRVAELNNEVVAGVALLDTSLAQHLSTLTDPYQPILDNMMAIEDMMGTRFADLVRPQVYIPDIVSGIDIPESVASLTGRMIQIPWDSPELTDITQKTTHILNPWKTDLEKFSSISNAFNDSHFGHLVEMEKSVAGLSGIVEKYDQITSISAQIASLQQIGLTDEWKMAITPPGLLFSLNDFALKQYEQIRKATDEKSIAWRLGLIDAASKYVDNQVAWGTALAVDSDEQAPETGIMAPDFSELPMILGPAKRDNRDVEEAFNESQFVEITDRGKFIIQKAKFINRYCKSRNSQLIFPEDELLNWAITLPGTICRDADSLDDVLDALSDMFIRRPVTDIVGQHRCFDDIASNRGTTEEKKGRITNIQNKIYSQVIKLEDKLIEHFEDTGVFPLDEERVLSNVMKALLNIQKDKIYKGANENSINDGIRNQLSLVYEVMDQARQGVSESEKDAGEVDIMLCDNGNPAVIIEGLKLDSFKQDYLDSHIDKALKNYNPNGCPLVYILIYASVKRFEDFWNKIMAHMKEYTFPYETVKGIHERTTAYTESRHAKAVLNRNGKEISVHLCAISMM